MKLFRIKRDDYSYGEYKGFVVSAGTEERALEIVLSVSEENFLAEQVELIAKETNLNEGVVLASLFYG